MSAYRSRIFQFYCVRLLYSIVTFFLVYFYFPLPDFDFYSSSDNSMEGVEALDRTVITKELFSFTSKFFIGNIFLTNIFFLICLNYLLFILHKRYEDIFNKTKIHYALLLPSIVLWSCIYSKELLFLFIVVINLIVLKLKIKPWVHGVIFVFLCFGVCLMRIQFIPIFILLNLFFFLKSDWAKLSLITFSSVSFVIVLVLVLPYVPIAMESVYNYFFIVEGNTNRYWIAWNDKLDFFYAIPIAFYTSVFKFFPSEVLSNKLGGVFVFEGLVFILIIVNGLRYNRWIQTWFLLLIMLFTLMVNFPLNIFNPGSALRYSSTTFEIILLSNLYIMKEKNENE